MIEDSILEYLTDEEIEQLKQKVGEKQFNTTFGHQEDVEDATLDAEGHILAGDDII